MNTPDAFLIPTRLLVPILTYLVSLLVMGFTETSHGAKITEKVRANVRSLVLGFGLLLLIGIVLTRAWLLIPAMVIAYLWVPVVTRTLTLVLMGRARSVSPFSWIAAGALIVLAVYVLATGYVI